MTPSEPKSPETSEDEILRGTVGGGAARVVAVTTTSVAREAIRRHEATGAAAVALARGVTAGLLLATLTKDDVTRLIKACEGDGFDDRRDAAMVRLFFDAGLRLNELVGLAVTDVDFDHALVTVTGKGSRVLQEWAKARNSCCTGSSVSQR